MLPVAYPEGVAVYSRDSDTVQGQARLRPLLTHSSSSYRWMVVCVARRSSISESTAPCRFILPYTTFLPNRTAQGEAPVGELHCSRTGPASSPCQWTKYWWRRTNGRHTATAKKVTDEAASEGRAVRGATHMHDVRWVGSAVKGARGQGPGEVRTTSHVQGSETNHVASRHSFPGQNSSSSCTKNGIDAIGVRRSWGLVAPGVLAHTHPEYGDKRSRSHTAQHAA